MTSLARGSRVLLKGEESARLNEDYSVLRTGKSLVLVKSQEGLSSLDAIGDTGPVPVAAHLYAPIMEEVRRPLPS